MSSYTLLSKSEITMAVAQLTWAVENADCISAQR